MSDKPLPGRAVPIVCLNGVRLIPGLDYFLSPEDPVGKPPIFNFSCKAGDVVSIDDNYTRCPQIETRWFRHEEGEFKGFDPEEEGWRDRWAREGQSTSGVRAGHV